MLLANCAKRVEQARDKPNGPAILVRADDRRNEILDRLADFVLTHGLAAASLRPLALAAGISDRMLLYYFKDKGEVIAAVLSRLSERLVTILDARPARAPMPLAALQPSLAPIVFSDELWPYMQLWLEIASLAARGDPLFRTVGNTLARGFLAWGKAQLLCETQEQLQQDAARLLVSMEGMLLLRSVGLEDVCARAMEQG